MAPKTGDTSLDLSGYTPSLDDINELKRKLRIGHARSLPNPAWVDTETDTMQSHERDGPGEHPTLQLSLDDLRELEDAFVHFNCKIQLTIFRYALTDI
jgi:hypothetical protein